MQLFVVDMVAGVDTLEADIPVAVGHSLVWGRLLGPLVVDRVLELLAVDRVLELLVVDRVLELPVVDKVQGHLEP